MRNSGPEVRTQGRSAASANTP